MIGRDHADRAADAYFTGIGLLTAATPAGRIAHGSGGTGLFLSRALVPALNGVFTATSTPDPAEVARLAAIMAGEGVPWSIQTRGEPAAEITKIAADHGLAERFSEPLLVCTPDLVRWRDAGSGTVRRITSADVETYADVLVAGFGSTREVMGPLLTREILDLPEAAAYLVEADGEPVTTGYALRTGDTVGVFNVATRPEHRGHGHARLVTEAVLRDGFAAGATLGYLQSSADGLGLYESMGFVPVETWTYLVA